MSERPALDPETHEDDTAASVWKRRVVLLLLIILVVAVAAPTFGGCSGSFSSKATVATFEVEGRTITVKEDELQRFQTKYLQTSRVVYGRALPDNQDASKLMLLELMLDACARAAGVHVSDDRVVAEIESQKQFQVGGRFDERRYREVMADYSGGTLTHEMVVETLRTILRVNQYTELAYVPAEFAPGDAAYDSWKKQNVRISVAYVASPYELQKAKFDAIQPTDDDLSKVAGLPAVKALLSVPQRKTVEVAYLKAADLGPEQFAAAKKFAEDAEIYSARAPLDSDAIILFIENRDHVFTKEHWVGLQDPGYAKARADWEKQHAEWEKQPKETRPPETPAPKDPGADYPSPEKQYPLWRERAQKEALARAIVGKLAADAEKSGKTLTEAAADYARFGVKVAKNAEPLTDGDIVKQFPADIARDSEFDQVAITEFKPPAEGATFKPRYHSKPVPTTRLADRIDDRGFMVLRFDSCEPARQYTLQERRQPVVDFWRTYQTNEGARSLAEEIRKKAEAAGPEVDKMVAAMKQAATDAGLTLETITHFSRNSEAPKPPVAEAGKTLSPEMAALARKIALRSRVQTDYQLLSGLAAGKLREPVLADEKVEAVFAVLVTDKVEPKPVEMSDDDLRMERFGVMRQLIQKSQQSFDFDALAKRLNLQRFDEKPSKAPPTPPADKSAGR